MALTLVAAQPVLAQPAPTSSNAPAVVTCAAPLPRAAPETCGGGCAASTAGDYIRFAQMLLDNGTLEEAQVLAPRSVRAMAADQMLPGMRNGVGETAVNNVGYGFGLTVAVRPSAGGPPILGSADDFGWGGAYGTTFWVNPQKQLAVVFMAHAPGQRLRHNHRLINSLVY